MPAWKIMVLNFAAAQRAARRARRCRAAGPLALLPENIFCIELLGAEAIINLGHCCRFFAAVTSGEYDEARRAFPLLDLRCARRIYLSEVSATHIYLSEVSATEAVWRLMFPSLQQPHKRRNCSDGRTAPWWRPWARWRPVARDMCTCTVCGESVSCGRMQDMRMRVCRACAGGADKVSCNAWVHLRLNL